MRKTHQASNKTAPEQPLPPSDTLKLHSSFHQPDHSRTRIWEGITGPEIQKKTRFKSKTFPICAGKQQHWVVQVVFTTWMNIYRAPPHPRVKYSIMDREITKISTDYPNKSDPNPMMGWFRSWGSSQQEFGWVERPHLECPAQGTAWSRKGSKLISECQNHPFYESVKIQIQNEADKAKKIMFSTQSLL